MAYHVGDCPKCGARLLLEYESANDYDDVDLTQSYVELTYTVKCWKCGTVCECVIASNLDEEPMKIKIVRHPDGIILNTRDLSKWEKMEITSEDAKKAFDYQGLRIRTVCWSRRAIPHPSK